MSRCSAVDSFARVRLQCVLDQGHDQLEHLDAFGDPFDVQPEGD